LDSECHRLLLKAAKTANRATSNSFEPKSGSLIAQMAGGEYFWFDGFVHAAVVFYFSFLASVRRC
jgi:hypothetical protein